MSGKIIYNLKDIYFMSSSYYRLIFKGKQSKDQHLINYLNERLKSWAKNVNEETK